MKRLLLALAAVMTIAATAQSVTLTATKYHPGVNGVGHRTADGSHIDAGKLSRGEIRWVAFSLDMFSTYGYKLGDTIVVTCDQIPQLNGEWVVKDKMGRHLRKRVDFLLPRNGSGYFHGHVKVEVEKKKAGAPKKASAASDAAGELAASPRTTTELTAWQFSRDSVDWRAVAVPHDWAIDGPFDKKWDLQMVAIKENGEDVASEHSGRSGALPWIGRGFYTTTFTVPAGHEQATLEFDGAMADAHVYVNGHYAGGWAYGYNAFRVDASPYIHRDGTPNVLAVSLTNLEESNRWYPGGGIYRTVKLVTTPQRAHLDPWDMQLITTLGDDGTAHVSIGQAIDATGDYTITATLAGHSVTLTPQADGTHTATIDVTAPRLWSVESPHLYDLTIALREGDRVIDAYTRRVGLRTIAWGPDAGGFAINGRPVKFKGVCLHHDLGPIGAAENRTAMLRQLTTMKAMGANAIRTSHNMPSTMMMELCDSLGLMVMAESFDAWHDAKVRNGYNRLWNDWWQRDIDHLVRNHRNHPSVVMWSVGNEIPEQWKPEGARRYEGLRDLCHSLDPTRPVTCGMDNPEGTIGCGFAQVADVPGFNYRVHRYPQNLVELPQGFLLGSETASTISSRGVYYFPDTCMTNLNWTHTTGQCTSYDTEYCWWSNLPDDDWAMHAQLGDRCIGEFVWTGYDYLGEPTPYDAYWPSRSSYFGICDLAGLPKDRYWLYRSHWNSAQPTIHLLPHWTWPGREGEVTPVYCYTSYPTAELFVNGRSQGRISKDESTRLDRYRLRWRDVRYEPGEVRVVAYDEQGRQAGEQTMRTAGAPSRIVLTPERTAIAADGRDLAYVTVTMEDEAGTPCPTVDDRLLFDVTGAGSFKAACNGDATSLEPFTAPTMRLFNGQLVVVLQAGTTAGDITLHVTAPTRGLTASTTIQATR